MKDTKTMRKIGLALGAAAVLLLLITITSAQFEENRFHNLNILRRAVSTLISCCILLLGVVIIKAQSPEKRRFSLKKTEAIAVLLFLLVFLTMLNEFWLVGEETLTVIIGKVMCFLFMDIELAVLAYPLLAGGKKKIYIAAGTLASAAVTFAAIIINNLWHYISYNSMFDFVEPLPLDYLIEKDLTYTGFIYNIRYPAVFFICAAVFALPAIVSEVKKRKRRD